MSPSLNRSLWHALIVIIACLPSLACYSGLTLIPTADTVGNKQFGIEFQVDGSLTAQAADTYILNTEFGLTDRFEAGVDFDLSTDADPSYLFNAKYVVLTRNDGAQAVAAGICNVGRHLESSPYLVGTQAFGATRGHLGAIGIDGKTRWFIGADYALTEQLTLMADYTSGDENLSSIGICNQCMDHIDLLAGAQFPNTAGDTLFTVHLVISGAYAR